MPKKQRPAPQGVRRRLPAVLTILFLGLLAPPDVGAEGVIRDSIGPVSSGRGGTNLAYSDNLSTLYDNPAALASMEGLHFDLSVDFLKTELNFRNALNDADAKDELFVLPSAWISWQVAKAPAPITVGIGFFMPAGFGAEFELQNAVFGRQEYSSKAGVYKILPSVAIDLGKGFSVGGGIGFAYEQAQFHTPYTFQSGAFAGVPGLVDIKADAFGYTWNLGVQYRPNERWTIGAAYIEETRMNLEGDFSLDVTGVPLPPEVTAAGTTADYKVKMENTWPRSVGIGTSYRFDWGTLAMDFLWFNWSSSFDAFAFHLSDGSNPVFNAITGPQPGDTLPLKWHDSVTVRLGGEYFLSKDDTIRAGYIYMTNPVPDSTLTPLIPANLQHAITVGYGHRFGALGIDFAYQFSFGERQHVGTSDISAEYDGSSMQCMAHWFFLGAGMSF